jgi:hypothetical protein
MCKIFINKFAAFFVVWVAKILGYSAQEFKDLMYRTEKS